LTFDDGGVSCAETVAPLLTELGMRGHFFIATGRLGELGYVSRKQVRDLAAEGHHIGSHTVTHANLRRVSPTERRRELYESKRTLEDLLGRSCESVSIPGGFADRAVVADAFAAGYEYVFVSEPRYLSQPIDDDAIGRWNIWHDTTAADLRDVLDRALGTRLRIQGRWYTLKTIKRLIGQERFDRLRGPFVSQN
jgi:peptidoglycan/xylan/chitin deacetylase (PgdA/CDA1 family)